MRRDPVFMAGHVYQDRVYGAGSHPAGDGGHSSSEFSGYAVRNADAPGGAGFDHRFRGGGDLDPVKAGFCGQLDSNYHGRTSDHAWSQ